MDRYVCIHGHFYQPPRENPWSDRVERQPSAAPFHDWNQRIDAECYAPNAAARILDEHGQVARRINNYEYISFNFGPTLMAWLEHHRPRVHAAVLEADQRSRERFSGHGSALAQAYHHAILPLAHPRDRDTEVRWGLADFRHRFGREPEGMWLPETAVDLATLESLAAEGVLFTLLEPHQALRWRYLPQEGGLGDDGQPPHWTGVGGPGLDTSGPYLCRLPSGRCITLFFYDGTVSRDVAFNGLLHNGADFARRLVSRLDVTPDGRGLVTIATDGETYGHHHRFGEMALGFALSLLENATRVRLTNLGEYLERHPPRREVEIREGTSWSCPHGVGRWSRDCGCGWESGHDQAWRQPLREALCWLRDELAGPWEEAAGELLRDPWAARDSYVDLLLDPSPAAEEGFFATHGTAATAEAHADNRRRARRLLELQRNALRMFTSCGWFFEDVGRIETLQILQYAGRALHLAQDLLGDGGMSDPERVEQDFLERLSHARSHDPVRGDARTLYERHVTAARERGLGETGGRELPLSRREGPGGQEGAPAR